MMIAFLAAVLAAGCVVENPPPPPPPPPPPALPAGLAIQPSSLAEDAQGNLWFTILGIPKAGRVDRSGAVTEFTLPSISFGANMIYAPDGNLWMVGITALGSTVAGNIVKLTPAGTSTFYELPDAWVPEGLTAGADGNLWFTAWEAANPQGTVAIAQITLAGAITIFPLPEHATGPATITSGPDHSLWFTESPMSRIGRVALDGKVLEYDLPRKGSLPTQIVAGSDGNIWFTENFSDRVARITPKGTIREFTLPVSGKYEAIVAGPDDNLWIAVNFPTSLPGPASNSTAGAIIRMTTNGAATMFPIPTGADITGLIAQRDGTLWFTERWVTGGSTYIGRITTAGQVSETSFSLKK